MAILEVAFAGFGLICKRLTDSISCPLFFIWIMESVVYFRVDRCQFCKYDTVIEDFYSAKINQWSAHSRKIAGMDGQRASEKYLVVLPGFQVAMK